MINMILSEEFLEAFFPSLLVFTLLLKFKGVAIKN